MAAATVPESPSKSPSKGMPTEADAELPTPPQIPALARLKSSRQSTRSIARNSTDAWEVLDSPNASLVEEEERKSMEENGDPATTHSWKSADNGAPLDDFGSACRHESR